MDYRPRLPREGVNRTPIDPLRETAILLGGLAVVGALVLLVLGIVLDVLLPHVPVSWEVRLFRPLAASAGTEQAGDERIVVLQSLLDRLASHWAENPYPLHVDIVAAPQLNAFAVPGGTVVVTSGLLAQVASENELAFVLAHEIGHFAGRDHLRRLGRGLMFSWVVANFGGGVAPADLVEQLAARGFDRRQEAAADRFGLTLVEMEYGHVGGALDFFQRLPDATVGVAGDAAAYFSTHPVTRARIAELRAFARDRGWSLSGRLRALPPVLRDKPSPDHEQGEGEAVEGRQHDRRGPQGAAVVRHEVFEGVEDHGVAAMGPGGERFPATVPYRSPLPLGQSPTTG